MKKTLLPLVFLAFSVYAAAQEGLEYFLPPDVNYDPAIPAPEKFFGHSPGEWHLTHDKLYFYMLELARVSERAVWEEYGRSHEKRPLGHLIVSSPENIRNLERLRQEHVSLCDPEVSGKADIGSMPLFVKLGYGVHGNESSAQNASATVAWYLTAGKSAKIDSILNHTIILIDPSLNPDGMQRHSTWVNSARSLNNNPDPASWEFSESWPGGRTNHYWFDLNRDYLMLQHPESQGRVNAFHKWKPNINTDHHEMGAGESFFFQPGVQSRNNPLTPPEIAVLTAEIGKYHEKYLNKIQSLYFTEESFDDFYVGKGSSYPDIFGSVGILFEQAGVKGHLRETPGGLLSFPFAIRNQVTVSLSTLEAGLRMREKFLESQRKFYSDALDEAARHPVKAYIFTEPGDQGRLSEFISVLLQHRIKVYRTTRAIAKEGVSYGAGVSYIVPLRQTSYRFIRSLFEPVKDFTDSLFYDVSTWVLPMSFNISYAPISLAKEFDGLAGQEVMSAPAAEGKVEGSENSYAWLIEWNEYFSPKALYSLQSKGIKTRVTTEPFLYDDGVLRKEFAAGTIVIASQGQPFGGKDLRAILENTASETGIRVYGAATGMTHKGIDLGSSRIMVLERPSVAMLADAGSNSGDAGEIWHLLDARFGIPVTLIPASRFSATDLNRYNVIIITGSPDIGQAGVENLRAWNRRGNTIIGYETGNNWLARNKLAEIEFVPETADKRKEGIYTNRANDRQARQIPGSIFQVRLDLTHPLCFGYTRPLLPVFKSTTSVAVMDQDIYSNPAVYTSDPLLSGYCTPNNIERIKNSPFASVHSGRVVSLYDNTNFRAIWYGTSRIFLNAVFFGQIIR